MTFERQKTEVFRSVEEKCCDLDNFAISNCYTRSLLLCLVSQRLRSQLCSPARITGRYPLPPPPPIGSQRSFLNIVRVYVDLALDNTAQTHPLKTRATVVTFLFAMELILFIYFFSVFFLRGLHSTHAQNFRSEFQQGTKVKAYVNINFPLF